ncbi:MAG: hypothetical protein K0R76_977 [Alphaproteobacteria bacterium]|nr:hypothetical protein [Alphaproteobacteria bacterium]MDF3034023.1 hypothetical protein [Alphaproteobacteria bacterium]
MKVLIFCFLWGATCASDLCLMLSPAEEAALAHAEDHARKNGGRAKNPGTLRLDGIIYSHEKSWTIWLNGRSIKAGEPTDMLRILNVTPSYVEIVWNPKPDQRHQICLKPNEVFQQTDTFP